MTAILAIENSNSWNTKCGETVELEINSLKNKISAINLSMSG